MYCTLLLNNNTVNNTVNVPLYIYKCTALYKRLCHINKVVNEMWGKSYLCKATLFHKSRALNEVNARSRGLVQE